MRVKNEELDSRTKWVLHSAEVGTKECKVFTNTSGHYWTHLCLQNSSRRSTFTSFPLSYFVLTYVLPNIRLPECAKVWIIAGGDESHGKEHHGHYDRQQKHQMCGFDEAQLGYSLQHFID